jgi:hypothetical protein
MAGVLTMEGSPGDQASLVDTNGVPRVVTLTLGGGGPINAAAVSYVPGNLSDWPIPPPLNVAAALDLLALVKGQAFESSSRLPAVGEVPSVTVGPFNFVCEKSGVFLIWAVAEFRFSGTVAGQADLTVLLDTVAQGAPLASGYTVGDSTVTLSQLSFVTLNRTLAHDVELVLNTNNVLETGHVEAGRAKILLLEL